MSDYTTPVRVNDLMVSLVTTAKSSVVWRSLTDGRTDWWPEMEFAAVPGAQLREVWVEEGIEHEAVGRVLVVKADSELSFNWIEPSWSSPLQVRFSIDPAFSGTRISVTESGFGGLPGGDALASEHAKGWRFHLARLVQHAERMNPPVESIGLAALAMPALRPACGRLRLIMNHRVCGDDGVLHCHSHLAHPMVLAPPSTTTV
jgi:uncharacterized protein YndB with AHSA1/START domain